MMASPNFTSSLKYDANLFISELAEASTRIGYLNARVKLCKFASSLKSIFRSKEMWASACIDDTKITFEQMKAEEVKERKPEFLAALAYNNISSGMQKGESLLEGADFSTKLIQKVQKNANGEPSSSKSPIPIENFRADFSKKNMDAFVRYVNDKSENSPPLIRAAVIHLLFAKLAPFEEGNHRTNRILDGLFKKYAGIVPDYFFYMSEAIKENKDPYFAAIAKDYGTDISEWIGFYLKLVSLQANKNLSVIDKLDSLYERTAQKMRNVVSSPKFDLIMESLFKHPYINSKMLSDQIGVTVGQAKRYLENLEEAKIVHGGDFKRNKIYSFLDIWDAMR
ncbi:Fic family protein [uncultured Fibrobacter sp.]|uniref:Fic family protein n=1 Tax=uncultured Fibrobacter sp. TaxID=261512 RepID=UPI002805E766|nr:Fic family protein [uncultured Fibrobacter sp.]